MKFEQIVKEDAKFEIGVRKEELLTPEDYDKRSEHWGQIFEALNAPHNPLQKLREAVFGGHVDNEDDYENRLSDVITYNKALSDSLGVQSGIKALLMVDKILAQMIKLSRSRRFFMEGVGDRLPRDSVYQSKLDVVSWQQELVDFLVSHNPPFGYEDLHRKFKDAIFKQVDSATRILHDIYGITPHPKEIAQLKNNFWRGPLGAAATANFFRVAGYNVLQSDPHDDIDNGIDLIAETDDRRIGVQVKTTTYPNQPSALVLKKSKSMLGDYGDILEHTQRGVDKYNAREENEGLELAAAVLVVNVTGDDMNKSTGILSDKVAAEFFDILKRI